MSAARWSVGEDTQQECKCRPPICSLASLVSFTGPAELERATPDTANWTRHVSWISHVSWTRHVGPFGVWTPANSISIKPPFRLPVRYSGSFPASVWKMAAMECSVVYCYPACGSVASARASMPVSIPPKIFGRTEFHVVFPRLPAISGRQTAGRNMATYSEGIYPVHLKSQARSSRNGPWNYRGTFQAGKIRWHAKQSGLGQAECQQCSEQKVKTSTAANYNCFQICYESPCKIS